MITAVCFPYTFPVWERLKSNGLLVLFRLFLMATGSGLQCVIVVFPDHTHFL